MSDNIRASISNFLTLLLFTLLTARGYFQLTFAVERNLFRRVKLSREVDQLRVLTHKTINSSNFKACASAAGLS
jgi:hypothetical protein